MNEFIIRLNQTLRTRQKTKKQLCEAIPSLTPHKIYDWNIKNIVPSAKIVVAIAQYLGTTAEFLVTGKDDNPLREEVDRLSEKLLRIKELSEPFAEKQ